jgi:tripartite-type tricarboxylate transporter receptor subunit TctC
VIVPYAPGPIDSNVRLLQAHMGKDLGQPIVVENRPGASGFIGAEIVAKSPPDGYTLLGTSSGSLVTGSQIQPNVPFNTLRDFTPITIIYRTTAALVAKSSLPVSSVKDVVELARRNPGKLTYGSTGVGSLKHVEGESFQHAAQVDLTHVPYNGFGPVVQALLGQHLDLGFASVGVLVPHVTSGKVKLLAVYNGSRSLLPAEFAKAPELTEALPGFQPVQDWIGLLGPAGMPGPIVSRLNAAAVGALNAPEIRSKIEAGGSSVVADRPEQFQAEIKASLESAAQVIKAARARGVKFE